MTGTTPASPAAHPGRDDLTPRIFRALYHEFELRTIGSTHVAVPKGTPWFAGHSLGDIARQISDTPPGPNPDLDSQPRHSQEGTST